MSGARASAVTAVAALVLVAVAGPAWTADERDARALLERAVGAAEARSFRGRVAVISFDVRPHVTELEVVRGREGALRVGQEQRWMMGRTNASAFLWEAQAGRLLRFGGAEPVDFSVDRLVRRYDIDVAGTRVLATGDASVVVVRERSSGLVREHLYVNEHTGLIVRRDTFQDDGRPARILAYTSLEAAPVAMRTPSARVTEEGGSAMPLDSRALRTLDAVGWVAPGQLPGGYELRSGHALPGPRGGSLQLVYSDGLYTLSLYEQRGELSAAGLSGAVEGRHGDLLLHRWPGSEPLRVVWSGDGVVFTMVTDAPYDRALAVAAALPHDPAPSLLDRALRRLERAVDRLWPFG